MFLGAWYDPQPIDPKAQPVYVLRNPLWGAPLAAKTGWNFLDWIKGAPVLQPKAQPWSMFPASAYHPIDTAPGSSTVTGRAPAPRGSRNRTGSGTGSTDTADTGGDNLSDKYINILGHDIPEKTLQRAALLLSIASGVAYFAGIIGNKKGAPVKSVRRKQSRKH